RWLRSTRLQDAALALAVIVPEAFLFGDPVAPGTTWRKQLELVALCVHEFLALLYRRRLPVPAFAGVRAGAAVTDRVTITTQCKITPDLGVRVAPYTLARDGGRSTGLAALAGALVPAGLAVWYTFDQLPVPGYRTAALIAGLAFYVPVTAAT
ncbi:hypothetical protein VM98_33345, partial [Streptomyces rubellomurinus subsp. indigoferus]